MTEGKTRSTETTPADVSFRFKLFCIILSIIILLPVGFSIINNFFNVQTLPEDNYLVVKGAGEAVWSNGGFIALPSAEEFRGGAVAVAVFPTKNGKLTDMAEMRLGTLVTQISEKWNIQNSGVVVVIGDLDNVLIGKDYHEYRKIYFVFNSRYLNLQPGAL